MGIGKDPVTGSLNAGVTQWLAGDRMPASYVAAQGTAIGRRGRVRIDVVGDTVWVGGAALTTISGEVSLLKNVMTAAACGALVLSACSGAEESPEETTGPAVVEMPVSGHSLLVAGPSEEVGQERLSGTPVFVNGCLGAQTGTTTYLVVWPSGTNVDRAGSDAIEIDGDVLGPGGSFVGKGTFVSAQPFPEQFPEIPLRCLGPNQEKIAWVQEIDEITE